MAKLTKGVFLSDIHLPDNIPLDGVWQFVSDYKPDLIVLGGDLIDVEELFSVDSMRVEAFKMEWYDRDVALLRGLVMRAHKASPRAKIVLLEGNHEFRYSKLAIKYGKTLGRKLSVLEDMKLPPAVRAKTSWVPYAKYDSYIVVGDLTIIHGNIYPDLHAKKYSTHYTPQKVLYGHLHDFQVYTLQNASPFLPARYALTCGCLCKKNPEWKRGQAHKWVNGFAYFYTIKGVTTVNPVIIEKGKFLVGPKLYKGGE